MKAQSLILLSALVHGRVPDRSRYPRPDRHRSATQHRRQRRRQFHSGIGRRLFTLGRGACITISVRAPGRTTRHLTKWTPDDVTAPKVPSRRRPEHHAPSCPDLMIGGGEPTSAAKLADGTYTATVRARGDQEEKSAVRRL